MPSSVSGTRVSISAAARRLGLHVNTLRKYERQGLINPARSRGNQRVFSSEDLARLEQIKRLVDGRGVNLAGVDIVLAVTDRVVTLRRKLDDGDALGTGDLAGVVDGVLDALLASNVVAGHGMIPMEETDERDRTSG
jgi:MerR family transcriptional regulator/heat shock protein HspR